MVKRHTPPETSETVCPSCGAAIKAAHSASRRRVQCPKCREVVSLESSEPREPEVVTAPPPPVVSEATREERSRLESLEARVAALEATLRNSIATAAAAPAPVPAERKLLWVTAAPGQRPAFSPEQSRALSHNLGGIRPQAITLRTPAADSTALSRAEWFKDVFERAGWSVYGPEEITSDTPITDFRLAVPELPVAKEAAATYLALKAAGFEPIPVLDSTIARQASAMLLTLPAEEADSSKKAQSIGSHELFPSEHPRGAGEQSED